MKTKTFLSRMGMWLTPPCLRKSLTSLKALTLLLVMVMSVNVTWAAEGDKHTLYDATRTWATSYNQYSNTVQRDATVGACWEYASNNAKGWAYLRMCPGKSKTNTSHIGTVTATTVKTKSIDITIVAKASTTINSAKLYVYGGYSSAATSFASAYSTQKDVVTIKTSDIVASTLNITPSTGTSWESGVYFVLEINLTNGNNNNGIDVSKFVVNEASSGTPTEKYTVTLKDDNTTLTEASAGAGVTLPSRTTTCTDYTFAGWSETNCATETTTAPTIIEAGEYKPTKNIELYPVFKKEEKGTSKNASVTIPDYATAHSWQGNGAEAYKSITVDDNITVSTTGTNNNGKYYSDWRLYQNGNGNAIVTAKAGKISSVTFTFSVGNNGQLKYNSSVVTSGTAVTGINSQSATFVVGASSGTTGQVKVTQIDVTYSGDPTIYYVAAPTCSSATLTGITVSGTPAEFWKGDSFNHNGITVTANYDDATSEDVTAKATFSTPDMTTVGEQTITVTYKDKTDTYTIDVKTIANTQATAYTVAQAKVIIDAGKDLATQVYVTGTVSKIVTVFDSNYGNISFNVSADGETTGDQFQFYRNFKGADKAKWASADEAPQVGDEVIGYGTLTAFGETYEFAEGNYIVSHTRPKKLTLITVSGTPDYFDTQSSFNHNGMTVTAHYNTGASDDADVTASAVFTAPDMTVEGDHKEVKVSYTEGDITVNASYYIDIKKHCDKVVEITKGDEENGTFSLSQTGNICADGGLTISVTDIVPAEHYHFKEITATNGTINENLQVIGIDGDCEIGVEFEIDPKYELKWMVSGEQMGATAMLYEGDDVTAPTGTVTVPEACANEGKVFVGWTADTDVDPETAPTFFAPHKMGTAPETYYAVFATKGAEGAATMEELTKTNIQSITTPKLAYTAEKTFSGSTLSYSIYGNSDADGRPWIQQKNASGTYIKVTAPENIKQVELTITSIQNNKGGIAEISEHTAYSGSVGLVTTDCAFTTGSANVGITSTITNNKATITTTESTKEVMIKVTTGARIWGIKTTYGAGATYSDYVTSCVVPTYSVTIQSNNTTMGSVTVEPEITEGAYAAGTEFTVMAEPIDDQVYRFVGWTITPDNTGATLDDATSAIVSFTVGTGDVTLTANFEVIPVDPITVTLNVGEHGTLDCDDCVNNTITEKTAGEGVLVPNVNANEGWAFLGWSTSSTATEAQYKPADADIFYPSDDNKTLYAIYAQLYKVTLKYTDDVLWQETAGGAITLPTDRNCKNETYKDHFAGWSTTEFADETTNPTETPTIYAESITPTEDIVLYPVFSVSTMGGTKWVKKTINEVEEGAYAIITTDGHAFNGTISDGHGQVTETAFAFDENNIATSIPTGICEISMRPYKNDKDEVKGYQMYNADKGYLYAKAAASKNLAWHSTEDTYWCVWSSNWEYYKNYENKYAYLRSYDNSSFRTYSTNSGDVLQFAKKESVAENKYWSKPANDVTNPELDLAAGDYLVPQTVKITAASYDNDLIYYYTTDGTTPVAIDLEPQGTTQKYDPETGIVLSATGSTIVKLIGYDVDGYTSQIAAAEYGVWATYTSLSNMYAGFQEGKPVGLTLTDAYIHKVYTPGGTTKQLFVQEKNSTLGVVLSGQSADFAETIIAAAEGKTITFTVTGEYALGNGRQQIGKAKIASCTISEVAATRPTAENYTAASVANNLLGLTQLTEVYAMSKESNIVTVNTKEDGTGETYKVYNIFNVVKTLPETNIKCVVKGLFNIRDNEQYIMPVLDTDFDVVEKQDAQLPTVSPWGSTVEAEPTKVASGETVTITPVAGFTTSYKVNDAAEWTTSPLSFNISETNTKLEIKATRPYYNDASATYYYQIDPGLTKYHITLPSVQTYYNINSDVTDQKAGETVILTISKITEHWNITAVTVEKADDETTTVEVANPETNKYTFVMPAYAVNVKVDYESDPTYKIDYLKGLSSGVTGDDITESRQYAGVELALKECTWKAAGYSFVCWKAFYVTPNAQDETKKDTTIIPINDNKIIVPAHDVKIKAMWDEAAWHKDGTWELVTKESDIVADAYYIIAENVAGNVASYEFSGNSGKQYMQKLTVSNWTDKTVLAKSQIPEKTAILMLSGTTGNWIFTCDNNQKQMTIANTDDAGLSWTDAGTPLNIVKKENGGNNEININVMHNTTEFHMLVNSQGGYKPYSSSAMAWPQLYRFYPKAWTVTFDDNVEDEEIDVPEMQRADHTTNKVTISTDVPVRTGYDFSIWNSAKVGTGELTANPGDEITLSANKTLYAQWNIKQYNVAVAEVENVTINAKPYGEADITEGTNADVNFKKSVVLSYSKLNEDYVFKSWKVTKADDETIVVPISVGSSTTFEVPAYDVTVSAVIESKATTQLTVTYHANGGKNKTADGPEKVSEEVKYNTTLTFTAENCPFEKNLCTFVGWNTKEDGTGTYKTQVTVKTDIDLYAMWEASAVEYVLDAKEATKVKVQEGVAPAGSAATFETTYTGTFGQLTNTNKGTLTLTGYAGKVITGVKMQMKSNASSGAGTIVVKVGDKEICSTSYEESFGSHSNSYSVAELQNFNAAIVGEKENITIVVTASDNSLYINGYTIEYEAPQTTTIRGNLTPDQYTTYCEPQTVFAGTYTGATFWNIVDKAYMSDDVRLNSIEIEQYTGNLEAGVPYIMLPTATELKGVKYGEAIANPVEEGNNGLYGTFVNYAFDENEATARDAQQLYVISNGTLYLCGTGCGVYAYRAYIKSDRINYVAPSGAPRRTIGGKQTPTTIENMFGSDVETIEKKILNGQLVIIRNGKMYNAAGVRMK